MTKYIPRHNHVIVKRIQQEKTDTGIYLPDANRTIRFAKLEVVHPGVTEDLAVGDVVWAEDMYEKIDGDFGIIDSKFIHCIMKS